MRTFARIGVILAGAALVLAAPPAAHARLFEKGRYCQSTRHARRFCPMDTRGGVHVKRQISGHPCVRGRNWFVRRGGVEVRTGCRSVFMQNHFHRYHH